MLNAKTDLDRYSRLVKEGFSTQQQYDAIQTEYTSAEASYRAALAKERQYEAEEKRVKSEKNDYIIRAPIDGIVLNDYSLTAGAMISPSSPILDIADPRMLKATLRVPELKIFSVAVGMPVTLRFDALPGRELRRQRHAHRPVRRPRDAHQQRRNSARQRKAGRRTGCAPACSDRPR